MLFFKTLNGMEKIEKDAELIHLQEKHGSAFWPMSTNPKLYSNCITMQYKHSKPLFIFVLLWAILKILLIGLYAENINMVLL